MDNLCEPLEGFADIYGYEKRIIEYLKWKLTEFFQLWGYEILEMPLVEKCTSFNEEIVGYSPWPEWDKKGCFYVKVDDYVDNYTESPSEKEALLIPEGTISVTRWIAEQLLKNIKNILPLKIFYITPCFRNELINKLFETKKRQFDQVGLEILGIQSKNADIENILLIVKGLEYIGFIP
jgi:histidyl-tRNA synthetase